MSKEVGLVIAIKGSPELAVQVVSEAKRSVSGCVLWVYCQAFLIEKHRTVKIPIIDVIQNIEAYLIFL